ncbi:Ca2+ transporting ATPase [Heterobasidion irregulare TC 32-1]|uniref:Ca2+ transporting ATPase n=1 Tax=Heterobasidion irregulare (strain TC 32-1) TaxID=747525 RepID=W4JP07_HETIT|nr:Ca2+ transporting ATPase [Heterobasidion irregulare TC 32-1]ETW74621.1 Ca2+ transporting ATPase [Heterobasidion irregulare TC 32-1]
MTQNRMLLGTVSVSFFTQLALVYVPLMQAVFQTEALPANDLCLLLGLAGSSMALHEGRRRYERSLNAAESWASTLLRKRAQSGVIGAWIDRYQAAGTIQKSRNLSIS